MGLWTDRGFAPVHDDHGAPTLASMMTLPKQPACKRDSVGDISLDSEFRTASWMISIVQIRHMPSNKEASSTIIIILLLVSTLLPKTEAWDLENMPDRDSGGRVSH